ncbi:MAG: radical SAM protein [bacterium]|nr:radical SAM protein [bacterium]
MKKEVKLYDKPFIKKFKIENRFYVYDVTSNSFFRVEDCLFYLIDNDGLDDLIIAKGFSKEKINEAQNQIDQMKQKGYFSSHRPKITYFHHLNKQEFFKKVENTINEKLGRMTLVVTENCNLRCRYCVYSGKYHYHRGHSTNKMSSDVMRKAVDFYFSHSKKSPEKHISFYGGSPLGNFELIKECVNYIKDKYPNSVSFNMTINGTILDEEKIKFLVENRFSILTSIDGPMEINDRNRVFRNGKGTFGCIINNLKKIKKMYPRYYSEKIRFNMVISPPFDSNAINEFITDPSIKPANIRFSNVNPGFTTFYNQFTPGQINEYRSKKKELLLSFNSKLEIGNKLSTSISMLP